jgi:hypothetical protein
VEEPEVTSEVCEVALDGALLWTRWALRRLAAIADGLPAPLIRDLLSYKIFPSGRLTERLIATDLPRQHAAVQRRVGMAVAQRALNETWYIRREGIEACATTDDPGLWTPDYRVGAFQGLFFGVSGEPTVNEWSAEWAPRVIAPLADLADVIGRVADMLGEEGTAPMVDDQDRIDGVWRRLIDEGEKNLPVRRNQSHKDAWDHLTACFAPPPDDDGDDWLPEEPPF